MLVFELNSRNLREGLIFSFHLKKTAPEAHRILSSTYGEAALSEWTRCEWFQRFKSGDSDLEDPYGGGKFFFSKIPNWRHYLLKTRAKRKKNWLNHWEWLNKPFWNTSKTWEWFRIKEVGFLTSWSREILYGVSLLVNSCFKDRIGRCFYIALWPATKNGSTTIIPSAENHEECSDMPPGRRHDRIFTVHMLGPARFGVVYYDLLKPNETITRDRYWTQLMRLSQSLKEERPQYQERYDKIILQNDNPRPHKICKILIGSYGIFFK